MNKSLLGSDKLMQFSIPPAHYMWVPTPGIASRHLFFGFFLAMNCFLFKLQVGFVDFVFGNCTWTFIFLVWQYGARHPSSDRNVPCIKAEEGKLTFWINSCYQVTKRHFLLEKGMKVEMEIIDIHRGLWKTFTLEIRSCSCHQLTQTQRTEHFPLWFYTNQGHSIPSQTPQTPQKLPIANVPILSL